MTKRTRCKQCGKRTATSYGFCALCRPWSYTVGDLTAYERRNRGAQIWTRRNLGGKYVDVHPLCDAIRVNGEIDPALETAARGMAEEREKARRSEPGDKGPLSFGAAMRRVLDSQTGKYAGDSIWKANVADHLAIAGDLIGNATPMSELRHSHYRQLWRSMAREHATSGTYGLRYAEQVVGSVRSAVVWLQQEEIIGPDYGLPAVGWKAQLRKDWGEITSVPVDVKPARPRYTEKELAKLLGALDKADPRLALLVCVGAPLRLGQVVRLRRSDVRGIRYGGLHVAGRGKKKGATPRLTMRERHALTKAMATGYLSEVEALYRAKKIKDFNLFAGGKLAAGKLQKKNAQRAPLKGNSLNQIWRKLETLAGVAHMPGRAAYGARRKLADMVDKLAISPGAKNAVGGWTKTLTREVYLEAENEDTTNEARGARAAVMAQLEPQTKTTGPN